MYKCYDLELTELEDFFEHIVKLMDDKYIQSFSQGYDRKKKHIEKSLHDFYLGDGVLDGSALKEAWFPQIEKTHIFLSHSHKDKELAIQVATILENILGLNVFIDSLVWGYADELLNEIDNKYALNSETNTYSYEIRNRTTSNIYLILQSSLMTMIDSAECLFFLNTENTVKSLENQDEIETRTASPWIMSELQFSSIARRRLSPYANRQKGIQLVNKAQDVASDMSFQISHKLPIDHLKKLSLLDCFKWMESCENNNKKGYEALTELYETYN
ncbi:hypothetical protein ACWOYG_004346 [Vibrio parahaemolyticus]